MCQFPLIKKYWLSAYYASVCSTYKYEWEKAIVSQSFGGEWKKKKEKRKKGRKEGRERVGRKEGREREMEGREKEGMKERKRERVTPG